MGRVGAATTLVAMLASGCIVARATPPTSQPAALPATAIASDQRVVAYPHGRWLLYGDGSPASPYAWAWIPTGATPPPPAPPARCRARCILRRLFCWRGGRVGKKAFVV